MKRTKARTNARRAVLEKTPTGIVGLDETTKGGFPKGRSALTDLTERKKVEAELRQANEQPETRVQQRTADLSNSEARLLQLNRTLQALNDCAHALLAADDEAAFLQQVCRIVAEICGHALVWIGYAEQDEAKSVRPVASAGFEQGYIETLRITWADTERGRGPTGTAIRTGQPSMCRDIHTDPRLAPWRAEALKGGLASSLVLPLLDKGQTFGAITIYSHTANAFSDEEVELLSRLALDVAQGITTLRLRHAHERAEEALRQSEELLRAVTDNSADAIYVKDSHSRWLLANPALLKLVGKPLEQVLGKTDAEIYGDPAIGAAILANDARILERGEPAFFEEKAQTTNGIRLFLSAKAPRRDADGRVIGIIGISRDITERKQFEAELERLVAERTAKLQELVSELEHFSYSITHDMRAPLRAMQGFAEMMAEACVGCQEQDAQRFLQRVRSSAGRMDALITDALNYNRAVRQELLLEPVDAAALLCGMLDTYPELQASKAQIEIQGEIPLVMGNVAGLTQCFSNLLDNAVKFAKPGQKPQIRIWAQALKDPKTPAPQPSVSPLPGQPPTLNPRHSATVVRIWVEDNGIGISKSMRPRVFDMFSRGHNSYEGTGIGLALVRKVMDRMGGKAGVESEEGKGSRFWLDLNLAT